MLKTTFSIITTVFLFTALFFSGAFQTSASALDNAVSYLQTKENSPWITMAQVAAGQSPDVSYLDSFSSDSAIGISAPILALASVGGDVSSLTAQLKGFSDGTQIGDSSTLNDDIFALLALLASGESGDIITQEKNYILNNQNEDGGWSFANGGNSDTNMTSMGIMVLIEAGVLSSDTAIQNALSYLRSAQNEDGGFPYDPKSPFGTNSDSSSDSWVISALYKVGEDPTTWTKGANTPITHLLSLQTPEGWFDDGFEENSFTPLSTSYAVIALSGKSYPIKATVEQPLTVQASFRIEGSLDQICSGTVQAVTALDVVKNAANQCGYAYSIDDTDFGPYLDTIANDAAEGFIGWIYYVNKESASVGAADYNLLKGDEVLWYYGDFAWPPLDISIEKDVYLVGEALTGNVQLYGGDVVEGVSIIFNGGTVTSDSSGTFEIPLLESGSFEIRAEKADYVRSPILIVTVGETVQEIALSVEITEGGGGAPQIPEVGFSVSSSNIPFGTAGPGGTVSSKVTIANEGTKNLLVKASVSGDEAFYFLKLNNILWSLFETLLLSQSQQEIDLNLSFPSEFSSFGQKQGSLIFWGVPQL